MPAQSAGEQLREIREGLELERVPGRIQNEERGLLTRQSLKTHARLDDPLDRPLLQSRGEGLPLRRLEYHATVRHRHPMAVHRVEVCGDATVRPKAGIQVTNKLMAVEVEVDPVGSAAPLGATEHLPVEAARFRKIPHLEGHMKGRKSHAFLAQMPRSALRASIAAARAVACRAWRAAAGMLCALLSAGLASPAAADSGIPPEPPPTFLSVRPAVLIIPTYLVTNRTRIFPYVAHSR
jgi:hypothetical protein